jgi:hypothetical protein
MPHIHDDLRNARRREVARPLRRVHDCRAPAAHHDAERLVARPRRTGIGHIGERGAAAPPRRRPGLKIVDRSNRNGRRATALREGQCDQRRKQGA